MVDFASTSRRAMIARMFETGAAAEAAPAWGTGPGARVAEAAGARTSARTMRPPGPLPVIVEASMPFSAASFLARGEIRMRPVPRGVLLALGAAGAGEGALDFGVAGAGAPGSAA